jgi:hypothetical protein
VQYISQDEVKEELLTSSSPTSNTLTCDKTPAFTHLSKPRHQFRHITKYKLQAVQFPRVSKTILQSIEDAEKVKGGPKAILTKLMEIACSTFLSQIRVITGENADSKSVENSPDQADVEYSDDGISQNLLECICHVMVAEVKFKQSSVDVEPSSAKVKPSNANGQGKKKGKKGSPKIHSMSTIPPGGMLNMENAPSKTISAIETLKITEYSNQVYWKFAPHLDPVSCALDAHECIELTD